MSADTRIICNGCGRATPFIEKRSAQNWRIALRAQGWNCRTAGGIDYCPECVALAEGASDGQQ